MPSDLKRFTEANRAAWNEVMPRHRQAAQEKWDQAFTQPAFVCLDDEELNQLQRMGIAGKDVAHLACNNGIELLSLKNLGARRCTGFDISDEAIQEAAARAERSKIDCQYIRADVYEIGAEYARQFDVVYLSAGCLGWMPDLKLFFEKAAALLRKDGRVFIHEIHPFSEMLPFDDAEGDDILRIIEPYFKAEPYIDYGGLDYVGKSRYPSTAPQYWFVHTLADIFESMLASRITLEHFLEYDVDISAGHRRIAQAQAGIPLSYILVGRYEPD